MKRETKHAVFLTLLAVALVASCCMAEVWR